MKFNFDDFKETIKKQNALTEVTDTINVAQTISNNNVPANSSGWVTTTTSTIHPANTWTVVPNTSQPYVGHVIPNSYPPQGGYSGGGNGGAIPMPTYIPATGGTNNWNTPNTEEYTNTLKRIEEIFSKISFLEMPPGLDLDNPTVKCMYDQWCRALEELKKRHEQLRMVNELARDPNEKV